jgi:hypothetical protein
MTDKEIELKISEITGMWDFSRATECYSGNCFEHQGCPQNLRTCQDVCVHPLPFLSDPSASWRLLEWVSEQKYCSCGVEMNPSPSGTGYYFRGNQAYVLPGTDRKRALCLYVLESHGIDTEKGERS